MTIPNSVMHAGQQLYQFESVIEGPQGPLAKFSCLYCGSGDYIVAPWPWASPASSDPAENFSLSDFEEFGSTIGQCCAPEMPAAVPEPGTYSLVLLAMVLAVTMRMICRRFQSI